MVRGGPRRRGGAEGGAASRPGRWPSSRRWRGWSRRLTRQEPDVVFNLIEGFGGSSGGEAWVTALLELLGLPYTGCPPEALALCRRKGRTKACCWGPGCPPPRSPSWSRATAGPAPGSGPVIVKPDGGGRQPRHRPGERRHRPDGPRRPVARVRAAYGAARAGRGVPARPRVQRRRAGAARARAAAGRRGRLRPAARLLADPDLRRQVGARLGRGPGQPRPCPAQIEPALAERLGRLAVAAFRATGCRDYARVDFRLDARGEPMILEVNPNPDLDPEAGWARPSGPRAATTPRRSRPWRRQALDGREARWAVRMPGSVPLSACGAGSRHLGRACASWLRLYNAGIAEWRSPPCGEDTGGLDAQGEPSCRLERGSAPMDMSRQTGTSSRLGVSPFMRWSRADAAVPRLRRCDPRDGPSRCMPFRRSSSAARAHAAARKLRHD